MQISRALEVLGALRQGQDPRTSAAEEVELANVDAIDVSSPEERANFEAWAGDFDAARARVREKRRALDLMWGPKSGGILGSIPSPSASPSPLRTAQLELQGAIRDLENRSLAQTALAGMVTCATTGSYLRLSILGRQQLEDLGVWGGRLGEVGLDAALGRIADLQAAVLGRVRTAGTIEESLEFIEINRIHKPTPAALRACAILLALSGTEASPFANVRISYYLSHLSLAGVGPEAQLSAATLLASGGASSDATMDAFRPTLAGVRRSSYAHSAPPEQLELLAAALTAKAPTPGEELLGRAEAIANALPGLPPLALAGLVLSRFSVADLVERSRSAESALARLGAAESATVRGAAAILSASSTDPASWGPRVAALDPTLRGLFPSALVPDAVLAALPLTTSEALQLFSYCAGSISRQAFFSDAPEVDYLALLLAAGTAFDGTVGGVLSGAATTTGSDAGGYPLPPPPPPLATGAAAGPLPSWAGPSLGTMGLVGGGILGVLFVTHSYWLLRAYNDYTRQHPLHSNAVPVYG